MSLVDTNWLEKNINEVKILDSSWHMPSENRSGEKEFNKEHIPNALFFDLDKNSDLSSDLPHMLPKIENWNTIMSNLGIKKNDRIIIYDNSEVISSCRCWYSLIYFGHDPKLVSVLDGGFKKWKSENKMITNIKTKIIRSNYESIEKKNLVKNKNQINENIFTEEFIVIDARSLERFNGKVPDPRKNVKSGNIPNSLCLPFKELINKDNTFKKIEELDKLFVKITKKMRTKFVFSCGSGVTACVLALAFSLVDNKYEPVIYDGSWAEYGKI